MNTRKFFTIRTKRHEIGSEIIGTGQRPLAAREAHVEEILERNRPKSSPGRGWSVYLRREREFSTVGVTFGEGYIHIVEPIGGVEKRDIWWIGVLQRRHHNRDVLRKELCPDLGDDAIAERYWSGTASEDPVWEWVAEKVRVVEIESEVSVVRPGSSFLSIFDASE